MPFYDFNETDAEDLPGHLQPDPHCVWVWVVYRPSRDRPVMGVHFNRDLAEWHAEKCDEPIKIDQTRLRFEDESVEERVWRQPGSGYDE